MSMPSFSICVTAKTLGAHAPLERHHVTASFFSKSRTQRLLDVLLHHRIRVVDTHLQTIPVLQTRLTKHESGCSPLPLRHFKPLPSARWHSVMNEHKRARVGVPWRGSSQRKGRKSRSHGLRARITDSCAVHPDRRRLGCPDGEQSNILCALCVPKVRKQARAAFGAGPDPRARTWRTTCPYGRASLNEGVVVS
jgi:hypothetical protein